MTNYLQLLPPTPSSTQATSPGSFAVISVVLSRPSTVRRNPRSYGVFRLWREGTDPASRGTQGRQQARRAIGVAP